MEILLTSQEIEPSPKRITTHKCTSGILNSGFKNTVNTAYTFKNKSEIFTTKTKLKTRRFLDSKPTIDALLKLVIFSVTLLSII